jgi:hypothetical protein
MNGLWGVRKPTNKGNFSWGLRGSPPSEKNKETSLATSKLIETIKFWQPLILESEVEWKIFIPYLLASLRMYE